MNPQSPLKTILPQQFGGRSVVENIIKSSLDKLSQGTASVEQVVSEAKELIANALQNKAVTTEDLAEFKNMPETQVNSAGVATPREGSQPSLSKALKSTNLQRLNVPAQAQALPEFLKQLIKSSKSGGVEKIPQTVGANNMSKEIQASGISPEYKQGLKRFGTDQMLAEVQDANFGTLLKDPFGNTYTQMDATEEHTSQYQDGKLPKKIITNMSYQGTPEHENFMKVHEYNKTLWEPAVDSSVSNPEGRTYIRTREENEALRRVEKTKPISENDEFRLYRVDAPPPQKGDLLERENVKRAAFNLPPISKLPKGLVAEEYDTETPVLILEQKATGEKQIVSEPRYMRLENKIIRHSSEFIKKDFESEPYSDDARMPFHKREYLIHDLVKNMPQELKDELGYKDPTWDYYPPGGTTFRDGTRLDTRALVEAFTKSEQTDTPAQPMQVTPLPSPMSRFNVVAQLGALKEILSGKTYGQDLGIKKDLPTGEQLKEVEREIQKKVMPAVALVEVGFKEGDSTSRGPRQITYSPIGGLETKSPQPDEFFTGGSAFHVGDGYLVTAKHVIESADGRAVTITTPDKTKHRSEIVYSDPKEDWSILRAPTMKAYQAVQLGSYEHTAQRVGQAKDARQFLVSMGYPGAKFPLESQKGILSRTEDDIFGQRGYEDLPRFGLGETSNRFYGGQSGGAIVDRFGKVIGIVSFAFDNPDIPGTQGGFVPIDLIRNKIQELEKKGLKK